MTIGARKFAYVTALNSENYLEGVFALDRNLRAVSSRYQLVVTVPETREDLVEKLGERNIATVTFPEIDLKCLEKLGSHYWAKTFFKLQVFNLVQFDKIVLLDCDILLLRNIDDLFALPHISAASVGPAIGLRGAAWQGLTSGVLVLEPSPSSYENVLKAVEDVVERKLAKGHKAGDQDVINMVYGAIWANDDRRKLPETYNLIWAFLEEYCRDHLVGGLADVAVVHFAGSKKPWHYSETEVTQLRHDLAKEGKFCMLETFERYLNLFDDVSL
ncbi:glycosyltransferase [Corynebacterium sp. HMSC072A02]|uniref:glycosyltransferase n=1 Tax=Corynebacterium sp. HMSC072A02 TaxID=1715177 RepID=UPI0008A21F82|nr:glycosyltransferase [Corynebacterium sp. HMSC072A02]OFM30304.1 hypothetical protein HMPREF2698_03200 [Corynebacterium sp. HMSC072A02]